MNDMVTEYHLYSDERVHKSCKSRFLSLGGVICTDRGADRLIEVLSKVRAKFCLAHEMRWAKVSSRYLDAYKSWMSAFFDDPFARFSWLYVNLSNQDWSSFRPNPQKSPSRDEKHISFFYQFLRITFEPLRDSKRWWVYPDAGFFSRDKVLDRVQFLFNRTYKKAFGPKTSRIIRLARSLDSKAHDLVQLADVLLAAATCCSLGPMPASKAKSALVKYFQERSTATPNTKKGMAKLSEKSWVRPELLWARLE
jgi:hypothetical protein